MIRLALAALLMSTALADARQVNDPWPTGSQPSSAPGDAGLSPAAIAKIRGIMAAIAAHYTGRAPTFGNAK